MPTVQSTVAGYLGIDVQEAETLASRAPRTYKRYQVPKRNGHGFRTIYHPAKTTKSLQYALNEVFLLHMPVHECAVAYRRGLRSPLLTNASLHAPHPYTVRLDLKDFFPSIRPADVLPLFEREDVLARQLAAKERQFLTQALFVAHRGEMSLAIGAPSSPAVSNSVMFEIDAALDGFAKEHDSVYTRYVDDLVFSADGKGLCRRFTQSVQTCLEKTESPNLVLNDLKTVYMSRGTRRAITGLVVTPQGGVSIGRDRKRYIRSLLHKYSKHLAEGGTMAEEEMSFLSGMLAFVLDVEPELYNRLAQKYSSEVVNAALYRRDLRSSSQ